MICGVCGNDIADGAVHWRFVLALQGEQVGVGGVPSSDESPEELLLKIAAEGDWQRYEDEVHQERSGRICVACRDRLMLFFRLKEPFTH